MNRRQLLQSSTALGVATAIPLIANAIASDPKSASAGAAPATPLRAPAEGAIPVAFLISKGAVIIDFCGPWEVFGSVQVKGRMEPAFQLYTVAETTAPVIAGGGMEIVPNFSIETAPIPKVLVIPAQDAASDATLEWIRRSTKSTDVTMSVCTGAFVLAKTGLLNGRAATTHHNSYGEFAAEFPDVHVERGARFVESGNLASAGGLSSGIDLSLRVVERYFGRDVATQAAYYLEYQGQGWLDSASNRVYSARPVSTAAHPLCAVCDMDVDAKTAPHTVFHGRTYYFCMPAHEVVFKAYPEKFVEEHEA